MKRLCLAAALVAAASGCDKLKSMAGKGDAEAPSSGGGLLSSLLDSSFEGEITIDVSGKAGGKDSGPKTLVFGLKSPKIRIDMTGQRPAMEGNPMLAQGASFILDPPAKKGYALVPAQKKAFVIDFDKMKAMKGAGSSGATPRAGAGAGAGTPGEPPKIEKTGKKYTVAGYQCEEWKITAKDSRAELCLAEGIKWMDLSDLGMSAPGFTAAAALSGMNHFPLRAVSYDAAGAENGRMEAKKIDKKKLDDLSFAVPPDYQVLDLSQMMTGLAGMGSAGMPGGAPPGLPPGWKPPPGFKPPKR